MLRQVIDEHYAIQATAKTAGDWRDISIKEYKTLAKAKEGLRDVEQTKQTRALAANAAGIYACFEVEFRIVKKTKLLEVVAQ